MTPMFLIQGRKDLIDEVAAKFQSFLENPHVEDSSVFPHPHYTIIGMQKPTLQLTLGQQRGYQVAKYGDGGNRTVARFTSDAEAKEHYSKENQ